MIARLWTGAVHGSDAEVYAGYICATGFAEYGQTAGNRGAWLLQRRVEVRPRCFGADSLGVVAGGDQQDRGGVDADAVELEQARRGHGDELGEEGVEGAGLSRTSSRT
jgi:hypothetical protein